MFTGSRVQNDLKAWIANDAPAQATVHVVVFATHTLADWQVKKHLKREICSTNKDISINYWHAPLQEIENRRHYRSDSEVLWPAELYDDKRLTAYLSKPHKFPFEPRPTGGQLGPFSSEEGRQLLEREFTLAGLRIRDLYASPRNIMRPLGFSPFGLGFGSMIVTFRNCPNNSPLALWWGVHENWDPLFPRKTYQTEIQSDTEMESTDDDLPF